MTEIPDFLNQFEDSVASTAISIRQMIKTLAPDAEESLQLGWKSITYRYRVPFCAIIPHKSWVNLQFHNGVELNDPTNALEGTGKSMRHLRIDQPHDLNEDVKNLILVAAKAAQ